MADALVALGGAFLAAALLARIGLRIGLPTIPFFMAAGIFFGPDTPGLVLVHDPAELELFAVIGLIMLLFHLGLEFSLTDLLQGGSKLFAAGGVYLLINVGGGFLLGASFGWGTPEALVIAGAVGVSSSAIVTKLLIELNRLANPETRLILGIMVVQDIFLALYLALLQPVLGTNADQPVAMSIFRSFGFLLVLGLIARFGPRLVGKFLSTGEDELLTVTFVGLTILIAGFAEELGVSAAIGAFMVGLILAETSAAERIQQLVLPLRDAFAAVFFFAFGLSVDLDSLSVVIGPVVIAIAVTFLLNAIGGLAAARLHRLGPRGASNLTMTILGRGEFSLILATLGTAAGLDGRLASFVALYVLVLAVGGPILAARSRSLTFLVPKSLFPRRVAARQPG